MRDPHIDRFFPAMTPNERIDLALEDRLPLEDLEEFQRDVLGNPALRAAYVERAWLHGQLHAERDLLRTLVEQPAAPVIRFPSVWSHWGAAAAAAVLGLCVGLLMLRDAPVAVLAEAEGCKWAGSELPTAEGSELGAGTLALAEGMATLRFANGATLTLEAPTTLQIINRMHCRLIDGSLVADVPETAHGFTVDTPEMKVVDLGTRFGVTSSGVGSSHVLVFEGEVDVKTGSSQKRLTTGKALLLGQSPPQFKDQEVVRAPARLVEDDGWTVLSTSAGRGKDAYVRRGDADKATGSHPLILVKQTELVEENQRRAYLTFDLASFASQLRGLDDAELVLDVESSGLGFSALVPDSRFAVYGVIADALDSWDESAVRWNNAPAASNSGLEPTLVRRLGTFTIRRGAAPAQVNFSTPDLLEFIRNDKNQLVTLVLLRETGESEVQGLVHAFAAKEHPTARPPALRLKFRQNQ